MILYLCFSSNDREFCQKGLYLLLLTNKNSNIVEDLETLRLLSKVIPEYASPVDEERVAKSAFEMIFAFDEVISMGHKENISFAQVRQHSILFDG